MAWLMGLLSVCGHPRVWAPREQGLVSVCGHRYWRGGVNPLPCIPVLLLSPGLATHGPLSSTLVIPLPKSFVYLSIYF